MDNFGFSLKFLPEFMNDSMLALFIFVIGCFMAFLTRAVVSKLVLTKSTTTNVPTDSEYLSIHQRVTRSCFWLILSAFTIWGYSQLPLLSSGLSKWRINSETLSTLLIIGIGTAFLIFSEQWIKKPLTTIGKKIDLIPSPKINDKFKVGLGYISFIVLAVVMDAALSNPEGFALKITATILILVFGIFLGLLSKNSISSLMGTRNIKDNFVAKIALYFVVFTFLLTSFEVWIEL